MLVSRSSMKAATETITVTSHGLNFGFHVSVITPPLYVRLLHPHGRNHRHSRSELIQSRLVSVESDTHGQALHDLHVIAGRIFGRQDAVASARGSRETLDGSFEIASERVNADRYLLTGVHSLQLGFFEI